MEPTVERKVEGALDRATIMAFERTRVAYERTMLAWVRTSASLITFGFAVWKFFDIEKPSAVGGVFGPRTFGLMLVGLGLASLVVAAIEQRQGFAALGTAYHGRRRSMSVIVAVLVALLGIFVLVAMLVRP